MDSIMFKLESLPQILDDLSYNSMYLNQIQPDSEKDYAGLHPSKPSYIRS